jgi:hypothetical protein
MKISRLFVMLFIAVPLVLPVISSAMAGNTPDSSLPFCQNPYEMTCPGKDADKVREKKIARIEKELKTEAFGELKKALDDMNIDEDTKDSLKKFEDIDSVKPKKLRQAIEKIFYTKLRIVFSKYITENNLPINWGEDLVKEALQIAIENSEGITDVIKQRMHDIVNETRVIAFQNDVKDNTLEDVHALYKLCSKSFEDNAFATTIQKQRAVVLCPGEMIGAIEYGNDFNLVQNLKLMPLVMTLGHEFSHHFDYRHYPSAYKDIYDKVAEQRSEFKKPIEKYMSEITADTWGLKVTKIIIGKISSPSLRSQMYAGALNDLCGSEDDGIHPSETFRIEKLGSEYLCQ